MIKVPEWVSCDEQIINDGRVKYDIASVIFLSRNLIPFELSLDGMRIDYKISDGYLLDFVSHMISVLKADMSKPIILDNEGWVIDGRHRLAKALYEGRDSILAVRFEENPKHFDVVEKNNG